jgi:hypothetical protein
MLDAERRRRFWLAALSVLVLSSCDLTATVKVSEKSPDGALIADWYTLSGGGAAGASSDEVSLRRSSEPFRLKRDSVFGAVDSDDQIGLKWLSNRELEIVYPAGASLMNRPSTTWQDVTIRYREVPRRRH